MRFLSLAPLLLTAAIAPLLAQSTRPAGALGTGEWGTPRSDQTGTISLLGKVALANGGALEQPVRIERVCAGVPHSEGFTDAKGNFSIIIRRDQSAMADASERSSMPTFAPGSLSESQLAACEFRASLAGYRSDTISLANRRSLDDPNIGTIFLHPLSKTEGLTISATTALAPKNARKAFDKGVEAEQSANPDEAQKELEKSVTIYPKFAAAWLELGKIYEQRDHIDQARNAYHQSIAADSHYLPPYERLCAIENGAGNWQEAADMSDRLLRLDPSEYPQAYDYNATANVHLNRLDLAEKSAREAVKLDTAHHDAWANYTLGYILAQKQNFAEAAQYYRAYLAIEPTGKLADSIRKDLAELEHAAQEQKH